MILALAAIVLSCGVERTDVKTLTDHDYITINFEATVPATIEELSQLPSPKWASNHEPRREIERTVYQVDAILVGAKIEDDEDVHLVIASPKDPKTTMIVEFPSDHCIRKMKSSILRAQMHFARAQILGLMQLSPRFKKFPKQIRAKLTGVLFEDKPHGQTGRALNSAELHPVLSLEIEQ